MTEPTKNPEPPKLPAGYILCRPEDMPFLAEWVKYMTNQDLEVRTISHKDEKGKAIRVEGVAE